MKRKRNVLLLREFNQCLPITATAYEKSTNGYPDVVKSHSKRMRCCDLKNTKQPSTDDSVKCPNSGYTKQYQLESVKENYEPRPKSNITSNRKLNLIEQLHKNDENLIHNKINKQVIKTTKAQRISSKATYCKYLAFRCSRCKLVATKHSAKKPYICMRCELCSKKPKCHIQSDNKVKLPKCSSCKMCFHTTGELDKHCKSQHQASVQSRDQCLETMMVKNKKQNHPADGKNMKNDKNVLRCGHCKFIATKTTSMKFHQIVHNSKRPFQCNECAFQTPHAVRFNAHILSHHDDNPHLCPHCTNSYNRPDNLQRHIKLQHPTLIATCDWCDFSSGLPALMKEHKKQHYPSDERNIIKCPIGICKFIATQESTMQLHQVFHDTQKPYTCKKYKCDFSTFSTGKFNSHVLSHSKHEPFMCVNCAICFTTSGDLKKHVKCHHPGGARQYSNLRHYYTELPTHKKRCSTTVAVMENIVRCEHCKFTTTQLHSMKLHRVIHGLAKPYTCTVCRFVTSSEQNFNEHILGHNKDELYPCAHCSMYFSVQHELNKHVKAQHSDSILECGQCDFTAGITSMMTDHMERQHSHHGNNTLECRKCTFVASTQESVNLHKIVHEMAKPYCCSACSYKTSETADFNFHVLNHSKDQRFKCTNCSMCFASSSMLNEHVTSQHIIVSDRYVTSAIGKTLLSKHRMKQHSLDVNNVINCELCSFIATKSHSISLHQLVHNSKKPYNCTECDFQTTRADKFNPHVLSHYNDCPFQCPHCGKAYNRYSVLTSHIRSIHPDLIMQCDLCTFSSGIPTVLIKHKGLLHASDTNPIISCKRCDFISTKASSFELHEIVHTKRHPYFCTKCDFKTNYVRNFKEHILSHNNDRPYRCSHCPKSYLTVCNLDRHIKLNHPDFVKVCDHCDYCSGVPNILKYHIKKYHPSVFRCKQCEFVAMKPTSIKLHQVVHATASKEMYICEMYTCGYQTTSPYFFNRHVLVHDRPYSCDRCITSFNTLRNLDKHVKSKHPPD